MSARRRPMIVVVMTVVVAVAVPVAVTVVVVMVSGAHRPEMPCPGEGGNGLCPPPARRNPVAPRAGRR